VVNWLIKTISKREMSDHGWQRIYSSIKYVVEGEMEVFGNVVFREMIQFGSKHCHFGADGGVKILMALFVDNGKLHQRFVSKERKEVGGHESVKYFIGKV